MRIFLILGLLFIFQNQVFGKLILVKGEEFTPLYGTSKKPIKVEDFYIDEFPVTNQEYLQFVKKNVSWKKSKVASLFADQSYLKHWKKDDQLGAAAPKNSPVVNVSWFAAKAFCENRGLRLPTVNEWEFVASRPIKNFEIKRIILDWYSIPTPKILPPVNSGLKNSSGIASLHGLIWEWTLDFNSAMVTGESRADASLDKEMYCGSGSSGSADASDYAAFLRFAFRSSLKAKYTVANLGFRCAKAIEEESP